MSSFPLPRDLPQALSDTGVAQVRPSDFSVVVRSAQQQDLAALAEVLASSFHGQEGILGVFYPLLRMGIYEDLRSRLRNQPPQYACLVALRAMGAGQANLHQLVRGAGVGDQPVGTVELSARSAQIWQSRRGSYLYLSNLAVQPEYRRHGVAQQLLQACEEMAIAWGYENIYLHVLENNLAARRLYRRSGYQLHEVETSLGAWLWGQPKQLFLRKVLKKST
jgi:ribosomal protein S18 acetylase RimI-like enzyme